MHTAHCSKRQPSLWREAVSPPQHYSPIFSVLVHSFVHEEAHKAKFCNFGVRSSQKIHESVDQAYSQINKICMQLSAGRILRFSVLAVIYKTKDTVSVFNTIFSTWGKILIVNLPNMLVKWQAPSIYHLVIL